MRKEAIAVQQQRGKEIFNAFKEWYDKAPKTYPVQPASSPQLTLTAPSGAEIKIGVHEGQVGQEPHQQYKRVRIHITNGPNEEVIWIESFHGDFEVKGFASSERPHRSLVDRFLRRQPILLRHIDHLTQPQASQRAEEVLGILQERSVRPAA